MASILPSSSVSPSSSSSSTPKMTPLTSSYVDASSNPSSYSARMGKLSRSSSMSSNASSAVCSRRPSMNAASAQPVMRNGFIIPAITLTPPDDKHRRSEPLPWQDFTSKKTLYVPVKTEDIGWEEGGLWWHGKYQYREVNLYGGDDDHIVGVYRGGPEGYAYTTIFDEAAERQAPRKNDEPAPQKDVVKTPARRHSSSSASSGGSSRTSLSRRSSSNSVSTESNSAATTVPSSPMLDATSKLTSSPTIEDESDGTSSTASSRTSSMSSISSTDTVDTACSTPIVETPVEKLTSSELFSLDGDVKTMDSPIDGAAPFSQLEKALLALKAEKLSRGADNLDDSSIVDEPESVSKPGQGNASLQPGKTLTLSNDGPSASHRWPKGRGVAKVAAVQGSPLSQSSVRSE